MKGGNWQMPKSDHEYFNCSEDHEADYVASLYYDKSTETVKEFLKRKCKSKEIKNSTHKEVYALLKLNGFKRR
jgi:hypothetical protein